MTLIYIDADNFPDHAAKLLDALRNLFGLGAVINVFHTADARRNHNPKQKKNAEKWTIACESFGLVPELIQPANGMKNSTDIAMCVRLFEDIYSKNFFTDEQRRDLTVVIVSGDSDFFHIVRALKNIVKETIICGHEHQINERYKNATRKTAPTELLTTADIENELRNKDLGYFSFVYGYSTTLELLNQFNVSIEDQPVSVHSILKILKSGHLASRSTSNKSGRSKSRSKSRPKKSSIKNQPPRDMSVFDPRERLPEPPKPVNPFITDDRPGNLFNPAPPILYSVSDDDFEDLQEIPP
ncbi:hypothetical protein GEMRC1_007105 [Eukaryota sp. GEM-RC1]